MALETPACFARRESKDHGAHQSLSPSGLIGVETRSHQRSNNGVANTFGFWCRGWPLKQERKDAWVATSNLASRLTHPSEQILPGRVRLGKRNLQEQGLDNKIDEVGLVVYVTVQRHRRHTKAVRYCLHSEPGETMFVGYGHACSASHKRGIDNVEIREHLIKLGKDLNWHGALSADVILTTEGPMFIDINPRLVEPVNAWRSGVDLVGAMLEVSLGRKPSPQPPGTPGIRTHQTLLAILGAAQSGRGRKGIACELFAAARNQGDYKDSTEEMTPWRNDRRAAIPLVIAAAATLLRPASWRWFVSGSVSAYALTPEAWAEIQANHAPSRQ